MFVRSPALSQAVQRLLESTSRQRAGCLECCLSRPLRQHAIACKGGSVQSFSAWSRRWQHAAAAESLDVQGVAVAHHSAAHFGSSPSISRHELIERAKKLPAVCPGCGAHSQIIDKNSPGFYDVTRRSKRLEPQNVAAEDEVYRAAMERTPSLNDEGARPKQALADDRNSSAIPICDRCHNLLYQNTGQPVVHPSMQNIQAIIEESPHQRNHIYHVLDAADFPMSLIPNLQHALDLPRLRTRNRRAKSVRYHHGRTAEVTFIITRSDLLAPKKEQVDSLMPYLQEVLRDALGRSGRRARLGNVRCVSSVRGWWTRNVKEEIWQRGGAGWMVGKANVGKSALFEVVFPKGRGQIQSVNPDHLRDEAQMSAALEDSKDVAAGNQEGALDNTRLTGGNNAAMYADTAAELAEMSAEQNSKGLEIEADASPVPESSLQPEQLDIENEVAEEGEEDFLLLPPPQPETAFPIMPVVSSLPGTTASPIRIPFGNGKGELIDLPGVYRSSLENYIKPEHRKATVMTSRVVPEQFTLHPGQSMLLGGVIRITPQLSDDLVMLAYAFVPPAFEPHVTATHKAIAIQTGFYPKDSMGRDGEAYSGTIQSIASDDAKSRIASAGQFQLQWDVTKRRTGSLTDKAAGKRKVADLPFIVYSMDLLIESVGWVELVCQVRRRSDSLLTPDALTALQQASEGTPSLPAVEVFTPEGKYVGVRRPMNAWVLGGKKRVPVHKRRVRPRMSISYQRRQQGSKKATQAAS